MATTQPAVDPARTESASSRRTTSARQRILIVGCPNVGKSALFNRLTGSYVTVSNYPGTTVGIARGRAAGIAGGAEVVDTPGMYSLRPITDEERVALQVILEARGATVLHVVDAKNLDRMLPLTLQMIEAGLPVVLVLNMADEAAAMDVRIDAPALERRLGIPVVPTVATRGKGIDVLTRRIPQAAPREGFRIDYGEDLERAIARRQACGAAAGEGLSPRTRAVMRLQDDGAAAPGRQATGDGPQHTVLAAARREAMRLLDGVAAFPEVSPRGLREAVGRLCVHPVWGVPILLAVLYFGLYTFVGGFGAGTIVDFLEGTLFEGIINPWFQRVGEQLLPWAAVRDLFVGEYGIFTLGLRYAVAIILPIVGTFFLAFSILEDSGYLPRLAMLVDRLFKKLGLNGRAVVPIVLGFGCDTMGTMVTRTLETRREKIIASILLALAIPCSAQLGVILGLLGGNIGALGVWAGVLAGVFLLTGVLAARLLPGEKPRFYMEMPPMRLPRPGNVLIKTYSRMVWYFREVLPLFLLASVFIWLGELTGLFDLAVRAIAPAVRLMGLPGEAAVAFLFGFFRRDYGAAGLFDLQQTHGLTGVQLAVAAISLTLFLPCVAQFLILRKERGWGFALGVSAGIVAAAFGVGAGVNLLLTGMGVTL
ncbi:MAG: ferrous iron transport protein B [Planctomycetes bacterium]|nr:ferrous iron transport protein B [Planctomycetota bacterium]